MQVRRFARAKRRTRAIVCDPKFYASYGGDVIRACRANKTECQ